MATGRRQHRPVTVTMPFDSATPQLFAALVDGSPLSQFVLSFGGQAPTGAPTTDMTIKLTGARIVATLAKLLARDAQAKRGLISFCTAGGMGVTAILEAA